MSAIAGAAALTVAELEEPAVGELLAGERLRGVSSESRLALATARMALRDAHARTHGAPADADALGVVVATRHAGLQDYVELFQEGTRAERPRVQPAKGPQSGLTSPAATVSIRLPAAGPNATVCNGAVGGLDALRYAADRLAAGDADAMLVCELDLVPEIVRADPHEGARQRAAVVVLQRGDDARTRGAAPCVRLGAVATAFSPVGDGAEAQGRAREQALAEAGTADAVRPLPPAGGGPVARLADAVAAFARGELAGRWLLVAHEAGAAGAAVLQSDLEGRR